MFIRDQNVIWITCHFSHNNNRRLNFLIDMNISNETLETDLFNEINFEKFEYSPHPLSGTLGF